MLKKVLILLAACLTLMPSVACTRSDDAGSGAIPENALSVYAPMGEGMTYILPGAYPADTAEDAEALKQGYNVFVSRSNTDGLVLSPNRNEGLGATAHTDRGTYYRSGDWFGYDGGVYLGGEKVIEEACVGMIAAQNEGSAVLIFTNTEQGSYVYGAVLEEGEWILRRDDRIELGSKIRLIYYDWPCQLVLTHAPAETMYIVTEDELIALAVGAYLESGPSDLGSIAKTVAKTPDYWRHLSPTSAVEWNGKLYIGDRFGVVEYEKSTQRFAYYPISIRSPQ